MNLHDLMPGDIVHTIDGSLAEILNPTEDGKWISVRYIEVRDSPSLEGTEDLCHADELNYKVDANGRQE